MGNKNSYTTTVKRNSDLTTLYNRETLYNETHNLVIHCSYLKRQDIIDKIMSISNRSKKFKLTIGYKNKNNLNLMLKKANALSGGTFFSIRKIRTEFLMGSKDEDEDDDRTNLSILMY